MKKMMKITMMVMMVLMLASAPLKAQIFIMDEEFEGQMRTQYQDFGLIVAIEGDDYDDFTPLGDGVLALTALGGAYLLTKRKKKRK